MQWFGWALRLGIAVAVGFALFDLFPLIFDQLRGAQVCPMLGFLPACFLVAAGYIAMAVALLAPRKLTNLFLLGWLPVLALALTGSTLEVMGRPTCPVSPSGTPLCFYSLAVASLLLPAFWISRKLSADVAPQADSD